MEWRLGPRSLDRGCGEADRATASATTVHSIAIETRGPTTGSAVGADSSRDRNDLIAGDEERAPASATTCAKDVARRVRTTAASRATDQRHEKGVAGERASPSLPSAPLTNCPPSRTAPRLRRR